LTQGISVAAYLGRLVEREVGRLLRFVEWSRRGPLIDPYELDAQLDHGARRALVATVG
jgi:hypothetical protein